MGQALAPIDGFQWIFQQGPMWLSATNPKKPAKDDHYTKLEVDPLSPAEVEALHGELRKLTSKPEVFQADIIRLDVKTSWGLAKQVYLLVPSKSASATEHILGMECIKNCRPIDKDPWFFTIVPAH